jgi:hypothetical protein
LPIKSESGQYKTLHEYDIDPDNAKNVHDDHSIKEHRSLVDKYEKESSLASHAIYDIPPYPEYAPSYFGRAYVPAPAHLLPRYKKSAKSSTGPKINQLQESLRRYKPKKNIKVKRKKRRGGAIEGNFNYIPNVLNYHDTHKYFPGEMEIFSKADELKKAAYRVAYPFYLPASMGLAAIALYNNYQKAAAAAREDNKQKIIERAARESKLLEIAENQAEKQKRLEYKQQLRDEEQMRRAYERVDQEKRLEYKQQLRDEEQMRRAYERVDQETKYIAANDEKQKRLEYKRQRHNEKLDILRRIEAHRGTVSTLAGPSAAPRSPMRSDNIEDIEPEPPRVPRGPPQPPKVPVNSGPPPTFKVTMPPKLRTLKMHDVDTMDALASNIDNVINTQGYTAAKRFIENMDRTSIPVAMTTSMIMSDRAMQVALNQGHYIPKPFRKYLPSNIADNLTIKADIRKGIDPPYNEELHGLVPKDERKKIMAEWSRRVAALKKPKIPYDHDATLAEMKQRQKTGQLFKRNINPPEGNKDK